MISQSSLVFRIFAIAIMVISTGCKQNGLPSTDPDEPTFDPNNFSNQSSAVTNEHFPLVPGTSFIYEGENDEGELERIEINVSHDTRVVDGVESAIVIDRAYVDGELAEETFDWFAQDNDGNVWYMGEASAEFEEGAPVSTEGSWESGLDVAGVGSVAMAGIQMKQALAAGDTYQQEFYPGVAEDMAEITDLSSDITLADGTIYTTLQIREWNPLEPEAMPEYKYYAPGIGLVVEEKTDGSERVELVATADQRTPDIGVEDFNDPTAVDNEYFPLVPGTIYRYEVDTEDGLEEIVVEVLNDTRQVMGVTTRVVRDTVRLDGILTEDTYDWFAQDNDGNVWYFGEEVENYNYDDTGNLTGTDNEGSWEAGIDGAQPGIVMLASPRVGDSYRQEYLAGEAEDLAAIDAKGIDITLADNSTYTTLRIKEWNPLEEDSTEFKYYAPGVGLVREENADGEEQADLIDMTAP